MTYQAQIVPGWTIQPDFEYIINPGGHVADPADPMASGRCATPWCLGSERPSITERRRARRQSPLGQTAGFPLMNG